jgi:hypothetical protein
MWEFEIAVLQGGLRSSRFACVGVPHHSTEGYSDRALGRIDLYFGPVGAGFRR